MWIKFSISHLLINVVNFITLNNVKTFIWQKDLQMTINLTNEISLMKTNPNFFTSIAVTIVVFINNKLLHS